MAEPARMIPPLPGRRERRKHATRAELLAAGRKLFSEKGLYESRIEDLSREAGIAKGTIYGYFEDKYELARAVVGAGFDELAREVRARAHGATSRPELLERVVRAHAGFFRANPDLLRVFHQARGVLKFDRPRWRPLSEAFETYLDGLAEVLQGGGPGRLARVRAREQAQLMFGAISGTVSMRVALRPRERGPWLGESGVRALVAMAMTFENGPRAVLLGERRVRRTPG